MSGLGGIGSNPFSSEQPTTQSTPILPIGPIYTPPAQTSAFVTTPTLTPSLPPPLSTEIVTKTELNPSLPALSTVSSEGINTVTLAAPEGQNRNNHNNSSNTISTAAIIFSIMIGFVIVGGCITLIFTRKRNPENKKERADIIRRDLYGEDPYEPDEPNERVVVHNPINSISPPLNLPPPSPQHFPYPPSSPRSSIPLPPIPQFPSPPQHIPSPSPSPPLTPKHPPPPPLPPIPQHSPIILYRNPSLKRNGSNKYDYNLSENHYQRYSQLRPPSARGHNHVEDPPP